jgi:hypothetical protein
MRSFILLCCLTIGIVTAANIRADPREKTFDVLEKIDSVLDKELDVLVRESNGGDDETALAHHQRFGKFTDKLKEFYKDKPNAVQVIKTTAFVALCITVPQLALPVAGITFAWRTFKRLRKLKNDYNNEILSMCGIKKQIAFGFVDGLKSFIMPGVDGDLDATIASFAEKLMATVGTATDLVKDIVPDAKLNAELSSEEAEACIVDGAKESKETLKKKLEKYFHKKMKEIDCTNDIAVGCDDTCLETLNEAGFTGWAKEFDPLKDTEDGSLKDDLMSIENLKFVNYNPLNGGNADGSPKTE